MRSDPMTDARLPAHLEIAGLIRAVQSAGGFATVLHKGERDAGAICIIATHNGHNTTLWERLPQLDGSRKFVATKVQDAENKEEFENYLARRVRQDPDCWQLELDIGNPERFIAPD